VLNQAFKTAVLITTFAVTAGCAIFRSPQVYPDEWNRLDAPQVDADGTIRDLPISDDMRLPPADLDQSVQRTFKLLRDYTLRGASADAVPQQVGNVLIGLTSFAAYRGITHPSAKTTAGVAALGSAAYAAGSGIKWGERAEAYNHAVDGLVCLLNEAHPFAILPAQSNESNQSGRQQLIEAATKLTDLLAKLNGYIGESSSLIQTSQKSAATVGNSNCSPNWNTQSCQLLTAADSAKYQQECKQLQVRRAALCTPPKIAAVYSVPAPEATVAFALATEVQKQAAKELDLSSTILKASDQAGRKLWSNTFAVMNNANGEVRRTGFDLSLLMTQLKASKENDANKDINTALAQGGQTEAVPLGARSIPRTTDDHEKFMISRLRLQTEAVRTATMRLARSTHVNAQMPTLNNTKFDACISVESKYAQAIASATTEAKPAATSPPVTPPTENELIQLGLKAGASEAEIESHIRTCQQSIKVTADGKWTPEMRQRLKNNECKDVKWP
jgi:hypothetical protein